MDCNQFIKHFMLPQEDVLDLINVLEQNNPDLIPKRSTGIPFTMRFLTALNFYGHGSYQRPTGNSHIFAQSQSEVSCSIRIVTRELLKLSAIHVQFPATARAISACKHQYYTKFGMPGIIGAMDGTQIAIAAPATIRENGQLYINRKNYHSINMLSVCDANLKFLFADAKFPGSVHDAAIWQMSSLRARVEEMYDSQN